MSRSFLLVCSIVLLWRASEGGLLGDAVDKSPLSGVLDSSLKTQVEQLEKNLSSLWSTVSNLRQNVEHDLHQLHQFQMEVSDKLKNIFGMKLETEAKEMYHMKDGGMEQNIVASHPRSYHDHSATHHQGDYHHDDHHDGHHDDHHDDHHGGHHDDHHNDHHGGHHDDHHDDHQGGHHDDHHESRHDDHQDDHHGGHHDDHHDDHHDHHDDHHGDHHDDHHSDGSHHDNAHSRADDSHSDEDHHDGSHHHDDHHDDSHHHNDSSHEQEHQEHGDDHQGHGDHSEHSSHDSTHHHDNQTHTGHSHDHDHSQHKESHNTTHHQEHHHHESHHAHHYYHHHHCHDDHSVHSKYDFAICGVTPNRAIPEEKQQNVTGMIRLWQKKNGTTLHVHIHVKGFKMDIHQQHDSESHDKKQHSHGFHVHRDGDLSNGCQSTGPHFNPLETAHGGPKSPVRHIGDLGNIECDEHGVTNVVLVDEIASLHGPNSIIGKSMVIHETFDDFGTNPDIPASISSGNAGGRIACCIIEKVDRLPPPIRKANKSHSHHHHK